MLCNSGVCANEEAVSVLNSPQELEKLTWEGRQMDDQLKCASSASVRLKQNVMSS